MLTAFPSFTDLAAQMTGRVVTPGDPGYNDDARSGFNLPHSTSAPPRSLYPETLG